MPKILMSDIKSGSENVKQIFRKSITNRTTEFLSQLTLSNDEILEVRDLSIREGNRSMNSFLIRLINSQKGPFNDEVIQKFFRVMNIVENMTLTLIRNADSTVTENTKYRWLVRSQRYSPTIMKQFVSSGEAAKLGFDFTKEPWLRAYMINKFANVSETIFDEHLEELYAYFDTLTEEELNGFYVETNNLGANNNRIFTVWFNYPKVTAKIITYYLEKFHEVQKTPDHIAQAIKMANHPACPYELSMKLYEETNNPLFLPEDVQNVFVF